MPRSIQTAITAQKKHENQPKPGAFKGETTCCVFFWAEWSHRNARAFFSFCPNLKFQRHGLNSKWDLTTNPNRQKAKTIQMLIFPLRMGLSRQSHRHLHTMEIICAKLEQNPMKTD